MNSISLPYYTTMITTNLKFKKLQVIKCYKLLIRVYRWKQGRSEGGLEDHEDPPHLKNQSAH